LVKNSVTYFMDSLVLVQNVRHLNKLMYIHKAGLGSGTVGKTNIHIL